jgi:dihydrofolate synthase / folylpolyglutamate synthase
VAGFAADTLPAMADVPASTGIVSTFDEVYLALQSRWPETKLDPTLERIAMLCDLLGQPQRSVPVIHLTGTNGKTSTARMVDDLIRSLGLRTGRFTSPHVESITERITIDGAPVSQERFVELYHEVAPYASVVDRTSGHRMSFFEFITGMAFAAFADAPVDAAVLEVGMGGSWDATNVADAAVAVITPIAVDHRRYLGDRPAEIAVEKSGIIKAGSFAVLAQQSLDVAEVLLRRAVEVGAKVAREGIEYGVLERVPGVGGQMLALRGLFGTYPDVYLPLYGAHQAHNAACALATVEAFSGGGDLIDIDVVREAFGQVSSPARLEVIRRSPTIVIDAAHNPHGAQASAEAVQESFSFAPLVGVVGVMRDKDAEGLLAAFEPIMASIVCTQNSTERAMPAAELGEVAAGIFGADRVDVVPRLDDAIEHATGLAETAGALSDAFGSGGVLVTGSVITAGEVRTLVKRS